MKFYFKILRIMRKIYNVGFIFGNYQLSNYIFQKYSSMRILPNKNLLNILLMKLFFRNSLTQFMLNKSHIIWYSYVQLTNIWIKTNNSLKNGFGEHIGKIFEFSSKKIIKIVAIEKSNQTKYNRQIPIQIRLSLNCRTTYSTLGTSYKH